MAEERIASFEEFWPYYLREHSKPGTRLLHFIGTNIGFGVMLASIFTLQPWGVLLALVPGYAFAWISHALIEKNRPATFKYPIWSFLGDLKMWALIWSGRIDDEVERHVGAHA